MNKIIRTDLIRYPRTPHVRGSRFQHGDYDLDAIPFEELLNKNLVIEEKIDGANCAVSFDEDGTLLLQSRGHYLRGGSREKQFTWLKQYMSAIQTELYCVLGTRYVLWGENMYAKHTIYYDALPSYFMEFDILDKETNCFLSEERRMKLLYSSDCDLPINSVRVLRRGTIDTIDEMQALIGPSAFVTVDRKEKLTLTSSTQGLDVETVLRETDLEPLMEGLYIKWEEDGQVKGRYKFVRQSFTSAIIQSETHWHDRPIIPNGLIVKHSS